MTVTWLITLVFETSIGLAVGLLVSILFYLGEVSFSDITAPHVVSAPFPIASIRCCLYTPWFLISPPF